MPRRSSSRRLATSANGTRGRLTAPATLAISEPDRCTPLTPHPDLGLPPAGTLCPSPPTQLPQQQAHFPVFYRPSPARSPVLLPHAPLPASSTEALCRPRRIPNLLPPQALFPLFGQLKTILSPLTKSPPIAAASPAHSLQSPYRLVPRSPLPSEVTTPSPLMDPPPDTTAVSESALYPPLLVALVRTPAVYILPLDDLDISHRSSNL
jgi:hypothetical protein